MILKKYRDIKNIYNLTRHFKNPNRIMWYALNNQNIQELTLRNGLRFKAPKDNTLLHMTYEIFIKNIYLPEYLSIRENDIVLDIGANIGLLVFLLPNILRIEFMHLNLSQIILNI